jgi:tetraacyldisaccharide 4'-kinase
MRPPSWWWREDGYPAALLGPFAALYGAIAAHRMAGVGHEVGVPVLCVGDLTIGGAGKTPAALALGEILKAAGERIFFLTRGYGGRLIGPVRVDAVQHNAADVGDEPLLLARSAPTIVSRDRVKGGQAAVAAGATVIVMDDGFQNPTLRKDFSLIVIDGGRGIGNGHVFPAGPLRAPLAAQLVRAQAAIVIGEANGAKSLLEILRERGLPLFAASLQPDSAALAAIARRKVLAFAGIGHPEKFFATLAASGIDVGVSRSYPDHHRYTAEERAALLREAETRNLVPVTTEKDFMRLAADPEAKSLLAKTLTLPVRLAIDEESRFRTLVLEKIGRKNR